MCVRGAHRSGDALSLCEPSVHLAAHAQLAAAQRVAHRLHQQRSDDDGQDGDRKRRQGRLRQQRLRSARCGRGESARRGARRGAMPPRGAAHGVRVRSSGAGTRRGCRKRCGGGAPSSACVGRKVHSAARRTSGTMKAAQAARVQMTLSHCTLSLSCLNSATGATATARDGAVARSRSDGSAAPRRTTRPASAGAASAEAPAGARTHTRDAGVARPERCWTAARTVSPAREATSAAIAAALATGRRVGWAARGRDGAGNGARLWQSYRATGARARAYRPQRGRRSSGTAVDAAC